jgi:hypothetical protein
VGPRRGLLNRLRATRRAPPLHARLPTNYTVRWQAESLLLAQLSSLNTRGGSPEPAVAETSSIRRLLIAIIELGRAALDSCKFDPLGSLPISEGNERGWWSASGGKRGVRRKERVVENSPRSCVMSARVRRAISANGAPERQDFRHSEAHLRHSCSNICGATEKQTVYESTSLGVG